MRDMRAKRESKKEMSKRPNAQTPKRPSFSFCFFSQTHPRTPKAPREPEPARLRAARMALTAPPPVLLSAKLSTRAVRPNVSCW